MMVVSQWLHRSPRGPRACVSVSVRECVCLRREGGGWEREIEKERETEKEKGSGLQFGFRSEAGEFLPQPTDHSKFFVVVIFNLPGLFSFFVVVVGILKERKSAKDEKDLTWCILYYYYLAFLLLLLLGFNRIDRSILPGAGAEVEAEVVSGGDLDYVPEHVPFVLWVRNRFSDPQRPRVYSQQQSDKCTEGECCSALLIACFSSSKCNRTAFSLMLLLCHLCSPARLCTRCTAFHSH